MGNCLLCCCYNESNLLDDEDTSLSRNPQTYKKRGSDGLVQPTLDDRQLHNKNRLFYENKIPSVPDGDYIDTIHLNWWGDYYRLESHHGFIQWLFPLPEPGVNWDAQILYTEEAEFIKSDPVAYNRVLKSYRLMLDFYGIKLINDETGEVERSEKWRDRFDNLNRNGHNNLRISRILKSLHLLGYEHFKYPLIEFFVTEILYEKTLPRCRSSCMDFWVQTLDVDQRTRMRAYTDHLASGGRPSRYGADVADMEAVKDEDDRMEAKTHLLIDIEENNAVKQTFQKEVYAETTEMEVDSFRGDDMGGFGDVTTDGPGDVGNADNVIVSEIGTTSTTGEHGDTGHMVEGTTHYDVTNHGVHRSDLIQISED